METEFAADVFNCEIGKFMFVCGYPKFVYALVCSKLRKHKNLLGGNAHTIKLYIAKNEYTCVAQSVGHLTRAHSATSV